MCVPDYSVLKGSLFPTMTKQYLELPFCEMQEVRYWVSGSLWGMGLWTQSRWSLVIFKGFPALGHYPSGHIVSQYFHAASVQ